MIKVHTNTFTRVPNAALDDPSLTRADKQVLTAICRRMDNDTNVAKGVTYDYLVKSSGSGKSTVCTSLKTLVEKGYIVKTNTNGFKTANEYTVNFDVTYEVPEDTYSGQCVLSTLVKDVKAKVEVSGAKTAGEAVAENTGDVTMHEVVGEKRHWTTEEAIETPIVENKEETMVRKPIKRDSVKQDTPKTKKTLKKVGKKPVEKPTPAEKTTTPSKPMFSRGYDAAEKAIPPRGSSLCAWSGYDGTSLAERDSVRGPLKGGKRVYSVMGRKVTLVMQEDGETVNFMASAPTVDMIKYDILKYLKIPNYREDQWVTISDMIRRNTK